jgi:2-oxo-4-hydroxy-4-carboxy--5-ureidoimidazoline (OHCU) decarboxylase
MLNYFENYVSIFCEKLKLLSSLTTENDETFKRLNNCATKKFIFCYLSATKSSTNVQTSAVPTEF